mmetsp:Transcript_64216/g.78517  ORF Transcript_64216/g.78517 Transcript_64216/m.78517 type:complete len:115 (-) Transcript_64216:120-464(-)
MSGKQSLSNEVIVLKLKRGGDEMESNIPMVLNLFLCFIALCALYGYYFLFCWVWLIALEKLGYDLLWAFFGCFVAVGIGMMTATAYSMSKQQIGWWEPDLSNKNKDPTASFCSC